MDKSSKPVTSEVIDLLVDDDAKSGTRERVRLHRIRVRLTKKFTDCQQCGGPLIKYGIPWGTSYINRAVCTACVAVNKAPKRCRHVNLRSFSFRNGQAIQMCPNCNCTRLDEERKRIFCEDSLQRVSLPKSEWLRHTPPLTGLNGRSTAKEHGQRGVSDLECYRNLDTDHATDKRLPKSLVVGCMPARALTQSGTHFPQTLETNGMSRDGSMPEPRKNWCPTCREYGEEEHDCKPCWSTPWFVFVRYPLPVRPTLEERRLSRGLSYEEHYRLLELYKTEVRGEYVHERTSKAVG